MALIPRLAFVLAFALLPLGLGAAAVSVSSEAVAKQKDGEPKVDDTFGRRPKARRGNDAAALAVELAGKGDFNQARALANRSGDSAAIKLVEWFYLRTTGSTAGYERLMAFVEANPQWPKIDDIRQQCRASPAAAKLWAASRPGALRHSPAGDGGGHDGHGPGHGGRW